MSPTKQSGTIAMIPASRLWQDLTWPDFAALDSLRTVAVLPVAAIEQHGPHLPLSVDAEINRGVLARAFELVPSDLPVLALPAQVVGFSLEHTAFPGTLAADPEILRRHWLDLGESVRRAGLRKLLILNSHGGQPQLVQMVIRELRARHHMLAVAASTFGFGLPDGLFPAKELQHGLHGGAAETSVMLHLRPDLVRRDKIANFPSTAEEFSATHRSLRLEGYKVQTGWMTQDLNAAGACGDARLASAEAGRAIVEHAAGQLAQLLQEASAAPLDTLRPGPLDSAQN